MKKPAANRLQEVDALRGLALLGIIAVNIRYFADPWYATSVSNPGQQGILDIGARLLTATIFETKFYLLFSFLFGYSFTLQMAAAKRAGANFAPRMVRRQLGLLAIGVAHAVLLFSGDILSTYAILGLVLLTLHRWPDRRALGLARALVITAGAIWILLGLISLLEGAPPDLDAAGAQERLAGFSGSAKDTLEYNRSQLPEAPAWLILLQGPSALAAFLIGLVAGRRRLLADPAALLPRLRRFTRRFWSLGAAGAIGYALVGEFAPGGWLELTLYGIDVLTAPLLTTAYLTLALIWFARSPRTRDLLASAGRIALTNYLLQSIALTLIFTGYGLGLINEITPAPVLLIAAAIFALQLAASRWWLKNHRYGPAEWALRQITNRAPPTQRGPSHDRRPHRRPR